MSPPLVADYLERALADREIAPLQVRLTQEGHMWQKPRARPRRFTATQHMGAPAVTLEFDSEGDIVRASSGARPFRQGDTWLPTPWSGEFGDYRELGGMRMPTSAEVGWDLPGGRFVYWRGRVTSAVALDTPFVPGS